MKNDRFICPLCLEESSEYEGHHVIWRAEGGTDDGTNILTLCKTCHAVLSRGNSRDAAPRDKACFYYALATHGLDFVERSGLLSDKYNTYYNRSSQGLRQSLEEYYVNGGGREKADLAFQSLSSMVGWQYLFELAEIGVLEEIRNEDDYDSNYNPSWIEPATLLEKALKIREHQRARRLTRSRNSFKETPDYA